MSIIYERVYFNKNNDDFKLSYQTILKDLLKDIHKSSPKLCFFIHYSTNYIYTI